jgi:protein required for attachment to host cells
MRVRVRIVVAGAAEARFYDTDSPKGPLHLAARLTDPNAHLHDRDRVTDRPGRKFDHAPLGARRGATARHSTGGEESPRKHEAEVFARRVAEELERGNSHNGFERVVVIAGPSFLGLLRNALSSSLRSKIVAEIPKDVVHQAESAVQEHLPQEAFFV